MLRKQLPLHGRRRAAPNALKGNEILKGFKVEGYACPSSIIDLFENSPGITHNNQEGVMSIQYVGIAGSARPVPGTDPNNGTFDCGHGWSCNNGMLVPNEIVKIAKCIDGTSNTMIIAEQSALVAGRHRSSNYYGGWFGTRHPRTVLSGNCNDLWQTGTTCVRFPPNSDIVQTGATDQMYRNNTVINSQHEGGVQIGLTDGSVRFVSENVDFQTWKKLACRNDGQVIGEF
ncbi:MAG: DUF1559 domain-containing protein [Planctomycetaceae bacterium]